MSFFLSLSCLLVSLFLSNSCLLVSFVLSVSCRLCLYFYLIAVNLNFLDLVPCYFLPTNVCMCFCFYILTGCLFLFNFLSVYILVLHFYLSVFCFESLLHFVAFTVSIFVLLISVFNFPLLICPFVGKPHKPS